MSDPADRPLRQTPPPGVPFVKSRIDVPETIGPYHIEGRLGAGGMGEVWLAHDRRLGRRVAVKRLRQDRVDRAARARLRREARAAARLSHPSIVRIFDLLEAGGEEWIVMEHVEGPRLAEVLRGGPLPPARAVVYGRQLAEGLAEAHAKGVVHRDLKAENVLVGASGAKILDFGLVRNMVPDIEESPLTRTGAVLGTVGSMAPEQARGLEAGPRSDLFSLGVLLYEMVAGCSPFRAASVVETLKRLVGRPPEALPPEVPEGLARLIEELLEKAPELRPPSAVAVARRLGRLEGELAPDEPNRDEAMEETELLSEVPAIRHTGGRRPLWLALGTASLAVVLVLTTAHFGIIPAAKEAVSRASASSDSPAPPAPLGQAEASALDREAWAALARYDLPGHIDRAIELFQRLVEASPDSAPAHAGLARAYWRKVLMDSGDRMWLDQALAVARHAVELDRGLAAARVSLGLILVQAGRGEEARGELEQALSIEAANADAFRGLAEDHQAAGRYEEAEPAFRRALELRPDDRELHDLLGTLFFRQGRLAEAEASFRRSIELTPDAVQGYRNLAGVEIARGRLDEAATLLESAIEIQPTPTLHLNQGTVFFFQGLYPQAAAAYEKALEFPYGANYHVTWANLGDAWRQIPHRRHEAPGAFLQAIRLLEPQVREDDAWLRSQLALYRAKAGQRHEALRDVAGITASDPRTLFRLAVACEVVGERERSLELLGRALDAGLLAAEVEREPELLALRSDPRFHRLMTPAGDGP